MAGEVASGASRFEMRGPLGAGGNGVVHRDRSTAGAPSGDIRELTRVHPIYLRAAEERGNVYLQRGLRGWRSNVVWLAAGDPATARAQAVLRGCVAVASADDDPARLAIAEDCVARLERAAAAELRLGLVLDDAAVRDGAIAWFRAQGVVDPVRLASILSPVLR